MPKKKAPELTDEEQFKKFVETAREHSIDETGSVLDETFKRLISKEASSKPKQQKP